MPLLLAHDLGPFAWLPILAADAVSVLLAVAALVPAALGQFQRAVRMSLPAILVGIGITLFMAVLYVFSDDHSPDDLDSIWQVWLIFCGPPLFFGAAAILLAWLRRHR